MNSNMMNSSGVSKYTRCGATARSSARGNFGKLGRPVPVVRKTRTQNFGKRLRSLPVTLLLLAATLPVVLTREPGIPGCDCITTAKCKDLGTCYEYIGGLFEIKKHILCKDCVTHFLSTETELNKTLTFQNDLVEMFDSGLRPLSNEEINQECTKDESYEIFRKAGYHLWFTIAMLEGATEKYQKEYEKYKRNPFTDLFDFADDDDDFNAYGKELTQKEKLTWNRIFEDIADPEYESELGKLDETLAFLRSEDLDLTMLRRRLNA